MVHEHVFVTQAAAGEASIVTRANARSWSIYGAERGQPAANGRKPIRPDNGSNKPSRSRRRRTATVQDLMVRRGSTVRVRQRASRRSLQIMRLACLDRKR